MSKRTRRRVNILSVKSDTMYGSLVMRVFSKTNSMKSLTDKRKNKRRWRRILASKKPCKFVIGGQREKERTET